MRKNIGIALIVVTAVTAGWNFSQTQNEVELTDLALANVEALANDEITSPTNCPSGTILCAWITGNGSSVTYYKKN